MWVKIWFILWHNKFKFKSDVYTGLKTDLMTTYKNSSQLQKNLSQRQKNFSQRQKTHCIVKKTCCTNNELQRLAMGRHELSRVFFCQKIRYLKKNLS